MREPSLYVKIWRLQTSDSSKVDHRSVRAKSTAHSIAVAILEYYQFVIFLVSIYLHSFSVFCLRPYTETTLFKLCTRYTCTSPLTDLVFRRRLTHMRQSIKERFAGQRFQTGWSQAYYNRLKKWVGGNVTSAHLHNLAHGINTEQCLRVACSINHFY